MPPEPVVSSALGMKYSYDKNGKPILTKEPRLVLNDDKAGKLVYHDDNERKYA